MTIDRGRVEYLSGRPDNQKIVIVNPKCVDKLYLIHDLLIRLMDKEDTLLMDLIEAYGDEFKKVV